ncbi:unnamed protein product [Mytilus edulis]|uniref:C2H2-type domain-containing protein n=1 Tax=Mytilus edulis TaxID=6550 RepID=A0A8S3TVK9_MYTED|nr:unnamed protein product [Mytilus edulis]
MTHEFEGTVEELIMGAAKRDVTAREVSPVPSTSTANASAMGDVSSLIDTRNSDKGVLSELKILSKKVSDLDQTVKNTDIKIDRILERLAETNTSKTVKASAAPEVPAQVQRASRHTSEVSRIKQEWLLQDRWMTTRRRCLNIQESKGEAVLSRHLKILETSCRICGSKKLHKSSRTKDEFVTEFKEMFNIDIILDVPEIHPNALCRTHEQLLLKYREQKKTQNMHTFKTSIQVVDFNPHTDCCKICNVTRGRKRKRTGVKNPRIIPVVSLNQPQCETETTDLDEQYNVSPSDVNDYSDYLVDETSKPSPAERNFEFETNLYKKKEQENHVKDKCNVDDILTNIENLTETSRKYFLSELICKLSNEEVSELAFIIGGQQQQIFTDDIENISQQYTSHSFLTELKAEKWLSERNSALIQFISGITKFSLSDAAENMKIAVCRIVEQVYALRYQKLVAPISFLLSLNIYSKTSSRAVVDLVSKTSPSGTYNTLQKWISKSGTSAPPCPPGTVMAAFDNEQVVAYKRGIAPNQKSKCSIITTVLYASMSSKNTIPMFIQEIDILKPNNWFTLNFFEERLKSIRAKQHEDGNQLEEHVMRDKETFVQGITEIREQTCEEYEQLEKLHFEQLHHFIQNAIDAVKNEHKMNEEEDSYLDEIDKRTHEAERRKDILVCTLCNAENGKNKIVCDNCKRREGIKEARIKKKDTDTCGTNKKTMSKTEEIKISKTDDNQDSKYVRYQHVPSNHKGPTSTTLGMPAFVNPNSNETVSLVLRHIGINMGIKRYGGKERSWAFVCCDGRPHSLYQKILEESVMCNHCNQTFPTRNTYKEHHRLKHPPLRPFCSREFDWLYMRIGGGHFEMNAMKAFFELNWTPFLEKLCELMGFKTENAKHFAKTCKDHHVAWQLLLTFHTSSLKEMVIPFIRSLKETNVEATVENYFRFYLFLAHNSNHAFLHFQICRFSQAIINFRMGMRRNNAELVKSAKYHLKELFYGRFHPHYQNIELFDCIQYKFMPDEVKKVWDDTISFTVSGDPSKGQDLDFVLEEKNKAIKQYLPSGTVPSDETWKSICCNITFFESLQDKLTDLLGLSKQSEYGTKIIDINNAITSYRPVLRQHLSTMNDEHTSVCGKKLHSELNTFLEQSTQRRQEKINSCILGIPTDKPIGGPVFITPDEEKKYEKKMTKAELRDSIKTMIGKLFRNVELQTHYSAVLDSLNDSTQTNKDTYLNLYFELQDVTDNIQTELDSFENE